MNPYLENDAFYFPCRVYYENTDAGGVVYHAQYYNFAERARAEWLRALDIPVEKVRTEYGLIFVARRSSIEWRRPARLDDLVVIESRLSGMGKVRMTIRHTFRREETVLAVIEIELVAVNTEFVPTALPDALRAKFPGAAVIEEKR